MKHCVLKAADSWKAPSSHPTAAHHISLLQSSSFSAKAHSHTRRPQKELEEQVSPGCPAVHIGGTSRTSGLHISKDSQIKKAFPTESENGLGGKGL